MYEKTIKNGDDNQGNNANEDINDNNGNDIQGNDANHADIDIESEPDNKSNDEYDNEERKTPQQYIDITMPTKYETRSN